MRSIHGSRNALVATDLVAASMTASPALAAASRGAEALSAGFSTSTEWSEPTVTTPAQHQASYRVATRAEVAEARLVAPDSRNRQSSPQVVDAVRRQIEGVQAAGVARSTSTSSTRRRATGAGRPRCTLRCRRKACRSPSSRPPTKCRPIRTAPTGSVRSPA